MHWNSPTAVEGTTENGVMSKAKANPEGSHGKATIRNERAEVHKAIWKIADDLRGKVTGWNFMIYVLGTIFYRFISEMLESRMNDNQRKAGRIYFEYSKMPDDAANRAKKTITDMLGYYIPPSRLFRNVREKERNNPDLNIFLGDALVLFVYPMVGLATKWRGPTQTSIKRTRIRESFFLCVIRA